MQFAKRSEFGEEESEWGRALSEARSSPDFLDLTVSNPTRCGLPEYPALLVSLADPAALMYSAQPLGLFETRDAVCRLYDERYGARIDRDHVALTASTSEAYSYLFRLLCDPGDEILVPSPSYPLFDLLARLHDVELVPYPLVYHDGWQIDPMSLRTLVSGRTRAVVVVHPNNPTGHYAGEADRRVLLEVAEEFGLPLIVDEVFLDYSLEKRREPSFASLEMPVPTFVLNGLSKLLALPQMKLAWIAACGPALEVRRAMDRLEVIADTFLSVNVPVQVAFPSWRLQIETIQMPLFARIQANLRALDGHIRDKTVSRYRVEGGWSVVLRVPAFESDRECGLNLLRTSRTAVHPGSFYGFPDAGWLVVSLLTPEDDFRRGIERILVHFERAR